MIQVVLTADYLAIYAALLSTIIAVVQILEIAARHRRNRHPLSIHLQNKTVQGPEGVIMEIISVEIVNIHDRPIEIMGAEVQFSDGERSDQPLLDGLAITMQQATYQYYSSGGLLQHECFPMRIDSGHCGSLPLRIKAIQEHIEKSGKKVVQPRRVIVRDAQGRAHKCRIKKSFWNKVRDYDE